MQFEILNQSCFFLHLWRIVFLVDRARYLEVNYSAYQLLKALGPGPIFDANLNNLYKIAEPHVVFEFLQQCLQFGIIGKVATIKTMRVIEIPKQVAILAPQLRHIYI